VPVSFILPFLTAGLAVALGTWRAAFAGHALVTAALVVLAYLTLPKRDGSGVAPSRTAGLGAVLRSPAPYLLGLSFAGNALLLSGITASLAPYLARRYGVSELAVQHWSIVAMLLNVAGSLLVGRLLNRSVPALAIGVSGIVLTVLSAGLIFALPLGYAGSIAAFWIFTLGSGLLVGMWALVPRCAPSPNSLGATSGLVTQLTLVGVLLGAPLSFAAQSAPTPMPMVALIAVVSVICLAAGVPIWRRASATQPSALPNTTSIVGAK
jgi:predicted MFS family arabinose efflux permease